MSELEFVPRFEPRSAPGKTSNPPGTLPEGTRLGEFELIRVIGDGGFGIVYLAWDHSLERRVALKEYMPATLASRADGTTVSPRSERVRDTFEAGLRSFINEARLLASFDHAALIKVYRFWEANGTACMVMPYYEAGTLQAAVNALPTPPDEAWLRRLLVPLCDALSMLHAAHCYHRDISPDNILLLPPADRPLLLDFGAARRVIGGMTHSLTTILKPGYAPIEQYAEVPGLRQGPATDVYALAATVHWMITGHTPPPAVARMLEDAYEPLAVTARGRYSAGFLQAIDRALIVRPELRTPTIDAFREDLHAKPKPRAKITREADPNSTVAIPVTAPPAAEAASPPASSPPETTVLVQAPASKTAPTAPPTPPSMVVPAAAAEMVAAAPAPASTPGSTAGPGPMPSPATPADLRVAAPSETSSATEPALPGRRRVWLAAAAIVVTGFVGVTYLWRQHEAGVPAPVPAAKGPAPGRAGEIEVILPDEPKVQANTPPAAGPGEALPQPHSPMGALPATTPPTAAERSPTPPQGTEMAPPGRAVAREPKERTRPTSSPPRRTAEQAAAEVRRVECARLTQRGLFSQPSQAERERARRLGCN